MSNDDSESPGFPPIMNSAEVCAYLKIHRSTLYRLLKTAEIPCFQIGGNFRFNREAIDQWRLRQEKVG